MKFAKYLLGLSAVALAAAAHAVPFTEGFNNISTLAGQGFVMTNNSTPAGQSWFQGDNTSAFAAQAGPTNSYIAADFLSSLNGAGAVDLWLISPYLTLGPTPSMSFYARSATDPGFADSLEVRFTSNASAATSGFTTLLTSITLPTAAWTLYSLDLPNVANGRFAFRYTAPSELGNYIGIDTLTINVAAIPIPEPSTYALMGLGIVTLAMVRRRRTL